jgi:hypothetical protein
VNDWHPEDHFRRNVLGVAIWEIFWGFGAACVSAAIVNAFLTELTGSKTLIGALGLTNLLALPPLFVTGYLNRRLRQKRRFATLLWSIQTATWLAVGIGVMLGQADRPVPLVALLFAAQALWFFANGMATGPTYELLAVAFGRRWGTAQGVQVICNRATGMLGGLFAAAALDRLAFPLNFGLTFLVGGAFLTISNLALLVMVEPASYGESSPVSFQTYARSLVSAVATNAAFVRLLWVLGLLACATMAQGFFVVFALERLALPASYAGLFTTLTFASAGVGGIVAGPVGDRFGHRRLLLVALGLHVASLAAAIATRDVPTFVIALALGGIAVVAANIAALNLTADLAPVGEKGSYTAVTRLVSQPVAAFSALLGGMLIDAAGYEAMFGVVLIAPLAAALLFRRVAPGAATART